jgi:hypothetical protein
MKALAVGALFLVACGSTQATTSAPSGAASSWSPTPRALDAAGLTSDGGSPAAHAGPQPEAGVAASALDAGMTPGQKSWNDIGSDERLALMKDAVLPQMKKSFQAFNAKDFAAFSCETCHGPGANAGNYRMPNASLPKLTRGDFAKAVAKHPDTFKFMEHTVVPQMAEILGLPMWEPTNQSGFGCGGCHIMD